MKLLLIISFILGIIASILYINHIKQDVEHFKLPALKIPDITVPVIDPNAEVEPPPPPKELDLPPLNIENIEIPPMDSEQKSDPIIKSKLTELNVIKGNIKILEEKMKNFEEIRNDIPNIQARDILGNLHIQAHETTQQYHNQKTKNSRELIDLLDDFDE